MRMQKNGPLDIHLPLNFIHLIDYPYFWMNPTHIHTHTRAQCDRGLTFFPIRPLVYFACYAIEDISLHLKC